MRKYLTNSYRKRKLEGIGLRPERTRTSGNHCDVNMTMEITLPMRITRSQRFHFQLEQRQLTTPKCNVQLKISMQMHLESEMKMKRKWEWVWKWKWRRICFLPRRTQLVQGRHRRSVHCQLSTEFQGYYSRDPNSVHRVNTTSPKTRKNPSSNSGIPAFS